MQKFSFDTVLMSLNAADVHRLSFRPVLAEAYRQKMGVIAMKVTAQGRLLGRGKLSMAAALGYVLSFPEVSTAIVGCQTPEEVAENADLARRFIPFSPHEQERLEEITRPRAEDFNYFKRGD